MKLTRAMTRFTETLMCSGALVWGEGEGRWSDMARNMGQGGRNLPSESSGNGHEHERGHAMNARRNDVLREVSARAHADAEPIPKRFAGKADVSDRTARRYANSGPPQVKEFFRYLRRVDDPWRIAGEAAAEAKEQTIQHLTDRDLIHRYWELLAVECEREGDDRRLDVTRGTPWLDRATASTRDAAINAEKSAIEREFAARGMTEEEVWR